MFPRLAKDDTRYRPELAEAVYWIMAISTILRAAAELLAGFSRGPALRAGIIVGSLGQFLGVIMFVVNMWSRVRMPTAAR